MPAQALPILSITFNPYAVHTHPPEVGPSTWYEIPLWPQGRLVQMPASKRACHSRTPGRPFSRTKPPPTKSCKSC